MHSTILHSIAGMFSPPANRNEMSILRKPWLRRMDALAELSPGGYYLVCWLLIVFAYASLLLFPVLSVSSIAFLGYIVYSNNIFEWDWLTWVYANALLSVSIVSAWLSTTLFQTRVELPAGKEINDKEHKLVINRINELVKSYNAPRIAHVKLTTRFELEIQRTPVNGYPSRFVNTLIIGMPVMLCMSPLYFQLLLSRHIGHLAQTRRRYRHRLIYLRKVWQLYDDYYNSDWSGKTLLFRLFFSWYANLFEVTTRAAVRLDQFEKDSCMLDINEESRAAEAISVFAVKKNYLENEFWPELNRMAFTSAKPKYLPYSSMNTVLRVKLQKPAKQMIFENELNRQPDPGDVYANLRDRLKKLDVDEFIYPDEKDENAAQFFFGDGLSEMLKQLDNVWYLKNKSTWNLRYKKGLEEKKQLKELRKQAAQALLSNEEARRYLLLIEKYVDSTKALPLFREVLKTNSLDAGVCYELGRLLLDAGDASGVQALTMAMQTDESLTVDCCQWIVKHMVNTGKVKEAQNYRRKILEYQVKN